MKFKSQRRGQAIGDQIRQLKVSDQGSPQSAASKLSKQVMAAREAVKQQREGRRSR